jgi:hypothetical protein
MENKYPVLDAIAMEATINVLKDDLQELKLDYHAKFTRVMELSNQIEKMRNCYNCKHYYFKACDIEKHCEGNNLHLWELKE